jgi:predicted amidophosphoribosyltransferase
MSILKEFCSIFLDALFPIPQAERDVLAMDVEQARHILPRANDFPIPEAASVFAYKDERVRRLIWALKYKKSLQAAEIGGFALYRMLSTYANVAGQIVVVPMPITRKRRRERGYNQCELLADVIEKFDKTDKESSLGHGQGKILVVRGLLARVRHTSRQTLKDRAHRLESVTDIFAVDEKALEQFRTAIKHGGAEIVETKAVERNQPLIIVIDDVVTTGSTMRDAINTLKAAGLQNVFGLSVAH